MIENLPELIAAGVAEATSTIEARQAQTIAVLQERLSLAEKALLEERAATLEKIDEVRRLLTQEIEREVERRIERATIEIRASALSVPLPKAFRPDMDYFQGDAVLHKGGTWIATRKTSEEPGIGPDWSLLANGISDVTRGGDSIFVIRSCGEVVEIEGVRGEKGEGFTVRGTWSPDEIYRKGDLVLENGSRFVALQDDPGELKSGSWELFVQRGSKGKTGDQGPRGDRGFDGAPGKSFLEEVAVWRDGKVYDRDALVAHEGKLFLSKDTTSVPPGIGDAWIRIKELG